jgi:hypothetical protein
MTSMRQFRTSLERKGGANVIPSSELAVDTVFEDQTHSTAAHDQSEDSRERRSAVLARNKRDLVAATEIPATSAISFTELQCDC